MLSTWNRGMAAADSTIVPVFRQLSDEIRPVVHAVTARAAALLQATQNAS